MDRYEEIAQELILEADSQRIKEIAAINLKYEEYNNAVRKVMSK